MKSRIGLILLLVSFILSAALYGQEKRRDKAAFVEYKNEFYDQIKKELKSYEQKEKAPRKVLKMDFSGMDLPTSKEQFTYYWHNDPISQGRTGTCWCFATTSYYESEIYRLTGKKVKLSEMFTVYWEYVEKARRYILEKGNSAAL